MSKVLTIDVEGPVSANSPEVVQYECSCQIMETGESVVNYVVYPALTLKTILGTYKLAAQLNSELKSGVTDYLDTSYEQTGFTAIFLTGGFVTL